MFKFKPLAAAILAIASAHAMAANNTADQSQYGNDNSASVDQTVAAQSNYASQYQSGNLNAAAVTQGNATNNVAYQSQNGNSNNAVANQQ